MQEVEFTSKQVFVLVPEEYRLEFLTSNSDEGEKRAWISRLTKKLQSDNFNEETKEELAYVATDYAATIRKPPSNPYSGYRSCTVSSYAYSPVDPLADYKEDLSMLIRASILLQNERLFARAVSLDPESISQDTMGEILEAVSAVGFGLYREG